MGNYVIGLGNYVIATGLPVGISWSSTPGSADTPGRTKAISYRRFCSRRGG